MKPNIFARVDLQIQTFDGREIAVVFAEVDQFDHSFTNVCNEVFESQSVTRAAPCPHVSSATNWERTKCGRSLYLVAALPLRVIGDQLGPLLPGLLRA